MKLLSTELLAAVLKAEFPSTATCWDQATEEIREMCREARVFAGIGEDVAVDFRLLNTPAQWNQRGVEGVVRFYQMLSEQKQQEFCTRFDNWLANWSSKQATIQSPTKQ